MIKKQITVRKTQAHDKTGVRNDIILKAQWAGCFVAVCVCVLYGKAYVTQAGLNIGQSELCMESSSVIFLGIV